MAPTSTAESQRQFRARRDADPEKRAQYLEREKQRWRRNVEAGKKKTISDLSERAQRQRRKKWRAAYTRSKERREALRNISTPPQSPEHMPELPRQPLSR